MKRKTLLIRLESESLDELRAVAKETDQKQSEIARNGVNKEVQRIKRELSKKVSPNA